MQLPVPGQRQTTTCFGGGLQSWSSWWAGFCALGNGCARELRHPGQAASLKQLPMKQKGTLSSCFSVFSVGTRPIITVNTLAYPLIFQWTNHLIRLNRTLGVTKAYVCSCNILLCRREYVNFLHNQRNSNFYKTHLFCVHVCDAHWKSKGQHQGVDCLLLPCESWGITQVITLKGRAFTVWAISKALLYFSFFWDRVLLPNPR